MTALHENGYAVVDHEQRADRYALARRVALDLTGLPPTVAEVDAFIADKQPKAYERFVDLQLAKPSYDEHWARLWLDLARYADSAGYADDPPRTIWAFRDYVINAFNKNLPFNQFTIEHLAADLLENPTDEQLKGTAFHRNTMTNNEGGTNDEEWRNAAIVDRVNTTFAVWMGTSMACGQCHTHKYDPISQKEYYQLFAFLNQTEDADKRDESPLLSFFSDEQKQQRTKWEAELAAVLGHVFTVFAGFKGGKGVATALGIFLGLSPWVGLAVLATWLLVAFIFRFSSLAALPAARRAEYDRALADINTRMPADPPATVKDYVNHIDYAVKLIGIDHVGISSDFDGGGGLADWKDASQTFNVTLELVRRGYTEEQIGKIWSGNLLRAWGAELVPFSPIADAALPAESRELVEELLQAVRRGILCIGAVEIPQPGQPRLLAAQPGKQVIQKPRLIFRARKAIEEDAARWVALAHPVLHHRLDHFVRHQFGPVHVATGEQPKRSLITEILPQQIPGGDVVEP